LAFVTNLDAAQGAKIFALLTFQIVYFSSSKGIKFDVLNASILIKEQFLLFSKENPSSLTHPPRSIIPKLLSPH
jgi:hypothetical protein